MSGSGVPCRAQDGGLQQLLDRMLSSIISGQGFFVKSFVLVSSACFITLFLLVYFNYKVSSKTRQ